VELPQAKVLVGHGARNPCERNASPSGCRRPMVEELGIVPTYAFKIVDPADACFHNI
jgi:hypothetical protein